jgi:hypothetical protein
LNGVRFLVAWAIFGVLILCGCIAPWLFGAWEMWWFWPFTGVLAIGMILSGVGLFTGEGAFPRRLMLVSGLCVPFLVYIVLRWYFGGVVFLDAERAFLLHFTGIWVGLMTAFFLRARHCRYLFWSLLASLLAMAAYGILNHLIDGSRLVLWAPRYEQYAGRASGPYFCPDHFSGAMELLVCMGLALIFDRTSGKRLRILGSLAALLGGVCIPLSQSRGGGLTLAVMCGLVVLFGFYQWPMPVRNAWRVVCCTIGMLMLVGVLVVFPEYRDRIVTYSGLDQVSHKSDVPVREQIIEKVRQDSRGRMCAGAWRAWLTAPWLGTGPGMHRHLWPIFAASGDGDREAGIWPTLINDDFHSYEVHNDWL